MSNSNLESNPDFKDSVSFLSPPSDANPKVQVQGQEEEKSENQSISSKEGFCPPKLDSSSAYQINKEEPIQQNPESHAEKFNGPLEKPKTASKAFGGISDFLLFFENRNPEIKEFSKKFQEMEDMEKEDFALSLKILNEEIGPSLFKSFTKMNMEFRNHEPSKPVSQENEQTQKLKSAFSKFLQKKKIKKDPRTEYLQLFEKEFKSLEEFYGQILYAYTIPGFLYLRMNEYLRTENWVKLDDLLIYTYCLFKAYLWGPTGFTDADSFEYLKSKSENDKLIFYRRADFDQGSLDFYQQDKIKEFSWTGVTSTSLLESATRLFAGKKPDKKPVLIVIEVDFKDLQPENFNALYLARISKCPGEEEVALAPGSIFELLEINQEKPEVQMRLKLVTDAKVLAQQGKFLHGMLQGVMRNEGELKFVYLKEKELSRAIRHCKGNQLIAKLEFSLCHLNEWSTKVFLDVLPTIKSLNSITFNSVVFDAGCLDQIMKCLGDLKIKKLEMVDSLSDENDIKSFIGCIKYFGSLKILKLGFEKNFLKTGIIMRELYNEASQYLDPECVFELNKINSCDIVVKGLDISNYKQNFENRLDEKFFTDFRSSKDSLEEKPQDEEEFAQIIDIEQKGIQLNKEKFEEKNEEKDFMKQIARPDTFNLIAKKKFFGYILGDNSFIPKRTLLEALEDKYTFTESLKDPILSGKQPLETLNLNFKGCQSIHHKDLKSLGCEGIQFLQSLKTLNLSFNGCKTVTDTALEILSKSVIQKLTGLNNLHLNFEECGVTDEGQRFQPFGSLKPKDPNPSESKKITNKGLRSLSLEGISKISSSLTSIHLNFKGCKDITDEGLESLFYYNDFESLISLELNFNNCFEITNAGIEVLSYKGLQKLKKTLKILSLSFNGCYKITDEGLGSLAYKGISHLESLTSLSLSFSGRMDSKITDKGIMYLCDQQMQHLSSLTVLRLDFDRCRQITNDGLKLLYFPNDLMTLHLSFDSCERITNDGLDDLSKKISQLKSLEHLHLSFRNGKMTDDGLGFLCSQGIKPLSKLNVLHLRFGIDIELTQAHCSTITDQSLQSIGSEAIQNLPELNVLHLDLEGCSKITAKGLKDLCNGGIQYLRKLTDLHLSFFRCDAITDEGLEILSHQGIFPLKHSLRNLYLDFHECTQLSDVGLKSLWGGGIQHLGQLATWNLKFARNQKITESQLLQLQYQINPLILPQLQPPIKVPLQNTLRDLRGAWKISSPSYQFSNDPNTADVLCKDRLGFIPQNMLQYQRAENLTLKFEQRQRGLLEITDLDIFNSLFREEKMKTFRDLKTLHLTFDWCALITDSTLSNLCSQGLQYLESLTSLHLSLNSCKEISDVGLESLGSTGIQPLKSLTSLSLSFKNCHYITDKGLRSLINIKDLELLNSLHLDFGFTSITDEGLIDFNRSGIQFLKSLSSLNLSFENCEVTDKGLREFCDHGLQQLESLKFMHLNFHSFSERITDKSLKRLYRTGLKSLASFLIDFSSTKITERLKEQLSQSSSSSFIIMSKNSLNNKLSDTSRFQRPKIGIDLGFSKNKPTEEDSVDIVQNKMFTRYLGRNHYVLNTHFLEYSYHLFYQATISNMIENVDDIFKSAKKDIIALILLSSIPELKDKVKKFINEQDDQEIQYLESLTSLNLILGRWAKHITDSALNTICSSIFQHLKSLTNLSLNFNWCNQITNTGLMNLWCQGIRYLTSLTPCGQNISVLISIFGPEQIDFFFK